MTAKFSKRHYEAAAENFSRWDWMDYGLRKAIYSFLVDLFEEDNVNFDASKFYKACWNDRITMKDEVN